MVYELYRRRLLNNKAVSLAELLGIIVRTLIKESGFGVTLPMFNTDTGHGFVCFLLQENFCP